MTNVFLGGSRRIGRLNADVRRRLDRIVEQRLPVLVGDANGADKAIQYHLHDRSYELVEVFCSGRECRNNVGGWPVRTVAAGGLRKDFDFYAAKDRAMADEATVGLMVWDGKSVGTLMNVFRLIRRRRKVAVYLAPSTVFVDLKGVDDWERFVSSCSPEVQERLARQVDAETQDAGAPLQATLL